MDNNNGPRFKCVAQEKLVAQVYSYRGVYLFRTKTTTNDVWKLAEYTPTNHIRKMTFATLDECAAHIDARLDNPGDIAGQPVTWTVRASSLKWFAQ